MSQKGLILTRGAWTFVAFIAAVQPGCGARTLEESGSNTHFWEQCRSDDSCGEGLRCVCGTCTRWCEEDQECGPLDESAVCQYALSSCETPFDFCQLPPSSDPAPTSSALQTVDGSNVGAASGSTYTSDLGTTSPDVTIERPPIPALDCSVPETLVPNGASEPTEGYTWDGTQCVSFVDTTSSARHSTRAACEVAYVACNSDVPSIEETDLPSDDTYVYNARFASGVDDPLYDFIEWTEADWIGWEVQEGSGDCSTVPTLDPCLSTRLLTLQTAEGAVAISVQLPWGKPVEDYYAPQRVKFRQRIWDFQYAIEVMSAEDETPVFLLLHSFSDQHSWTLGNFQAHQGYPIAHASDLSECFTERVWTSTLVSFYFDDGQSAVKQAFPTLDEVELQPFESTELADPTTGHTFDISVGAGTTYVPTPAAPDCGSAAVFQDLFAHRMQ